MNICLHCFLFVKNLFGLEVDDEFSYISEIIEIIQKSVKLIISTKSGIH